MKRNFLILALALCTIFASSRALAGPIGGTLGSSGPAGAGALSSAAIFQRTGAIFVLDPSQRSTLTLSGTNVTAANDAAMGWLQLTQTGSTPLVYDTTHTANGKACISTTNASSQQQLVNTTYSPVNIGAGGGGFSAWGTAGWSAVALVNVVSTTSLGGGLFFGQLADSAKSGMWIGGTTFGTPGNWLYETQSSGTGQNAKQILPSTFPTGLMVVGVTFDGFRVRQWFNGAHDVNDGVAQSAGAILHAGFGLAEGFGGGASGVTRYYKAAWWDRPVSDQVMRDVALALAREYGMVTTANKFVALGDSMTFGFIPIANQPPTQIPANQTWPGVATAAAQGLGKSVSVTNIAVSGTFASGWASTVGTFTIGQQFDPTMKSTIVGIMLGHNDLAVNSATTTQVESYLSNLITWSKRQGWKPILVTIPASGTILTTNETSRQTINAWMKSSSGVPVVDPTQITVIQDYTNTTYWYDQVHPTPACDALIGALFSATLESLL